MYINIYITTYYKEILWFQCILIVIELSIIKVVII